MKNSQSYQGQPLNRLDGVVKVTGNAKYAAEYNVPNLLHGCIISSAITKGVILAFHAEKALALPGVLKFFTHENRPAVANYDVFYKDMDTPAGSPFRPLYDNTICYNGQPIGLVVAETFELARYAASLITVSYQIEDFQTDLNANMGSARSPKSGIANYFKPLPPKPTGHFERVFAESPIQYTGDFFHYPEHHNPMELFASTSVYEGDGKLTIYDKTQGAVNSQLYVANIFGLHYKDVRVISPYVGGAFGSGLRPQYQLFLSAMAALDMKRNVRVVMDRSQMFSFGHRPACRLSVAMGAEKDGTLQALRTGAHAETSQFEDYTETVVNWGNMLYPVKNITLEYKLVPLDVFTPMDMRAPGGATGIHALEVAMDALSYSLNIDPVALRLINYTDRDVLADKPYSSKELKECIRQGAERFGWDKRTSEPRSMRQGKQLIGWGMATGIWEAMQVPARAMAEMDASGKLRVTCATADIGTGTRTVMTQIAADEMGLRMEDVTFEYGDSDMPIAPIQGGSYTVASIGSAVKKVCKALKKKILKKAKSIHHSPITSGKLKNVIFKRNGISMLNSAEASLTFAEVFSQSGSTLLRAKRTTVPPFFKTRKYSRATHSAAFVEVMVDEDVGMVKVTRAVTAVAAGKIINPKTATSQVLGGMIWGISKALHEHSVFDHTIGKIMNQNLAEYHIPTHADVHDLDVIFVDEYDTIVNDLGVKGVGEIGLVAMTPAIANALYHATGKRINDLPITLDMLL